MLAVTPSLASASPSTVKLSNSVSRAVSRAPRTGAVADNSQIAFQVNLKLPDQQAAESFATAVSTPGSSKHTDVPDPGAVGAAVLAQRRRGGSRPGNAFLRSSGFAVTNVSADRMAIDASGSAARRSSARSRQSVAN